MTIMIKKISRHKRSSTLPISLHSYAAFCTTLKYTKPNSSQKIQFEDFKEILKLYSILKWRYLKIRCYFCISVHLQCTDQGNTAWCWSRLDILVYSYHCNALKKALSWYVLVHWWICGSLIALKIIHCVLSLSNVTFLYGFTRRYFRFQKRLHLKFQ